MTAELERAVADHYGVAGLLARILDGVVAAGGDPDRLQPEDLAPVDEFHIGGRAATKFAVSKMRLRDGDHVLDIGCGLGGAARYIASTIGCQVSGVDLTPEYVGVARELAMRTGLAARTAYHVASALDMPFSDSMFDAAITLHVAMNIRDRAGLYAEAARVLKPGACFCIYDAMRGPAGDVRYPVPWAETAATSHLTTPDQMRGLLAEAGFAVTVVEDRTEFAIAVFRERIAAASGGPPPLGTHLMMGANAGRKAKNMLANLENGAIVPTVMIATRR